MILDEFDERFMNRHKVLQDLFEFDIGLVVLIMVCA